MIVVNRCFHLIDLCHENWLINIINLVPSSGPLPAFQWAWDEAILSGGAARMLDNRMLRQESGKLVSSTTVQCCSMILAS